MDYIVAIWIFLIKDGNNLYILLKFLILLFLILVFLNFLLI